MEELGFYYPLFNLEHRILANHSIPFFSLFSSKPDKYHINVRWGVDAREANKKYEEQLNHLLRQKYDQILISGEDISSLSQLELDGMRKKIQSYGYDMRVIVFVRSPISTLNSEIQQRVKGGGYIEQSHDCTIIARMKKIESVFPQAEFFSFREACEHKYGPVGYFLEIIGIVDFSSLEFFTSNESLSAQATRLISFINKEQPVFIKGKINPFRREGDTNKFKLIQGDKFQLNENELKKFRNKINQENKYLLSKFGASFCDEKLDWSLDTKEPNWSDEQLERLKISISKVDENLKMIAYDYFKNIICLDKEKLSYLFLKNVQNREKGRKGYSKYRCEVIKFNCLKIDLLYGWNLDKPTSGILNSHLFSGWIIGKKSSVVSIELRKNKHLLKSISINVNRPDVLQKHSNIIGAESSGFRTSLIDILNEHEPLYSLEIIAVFKTQEKIPLGKIDVIQRA